MGTLIKRVSAVLLSLLLLGGCQSPPGEKLGEEPPLSPVASPLPTAVTMPPGAANTPPGSLPITPTPKEESPIATLAAGPPSLPVAWLLEQVQSAQMITITALDAPELVVPASGALRQRLEQAITNQTQATMLSTTWLSAVLPYPNYQLLLHASSYETTINWGGPKYITVNRHPVDDSAGQDVSAYYLQPTAALWEVLAAAAPPPHYGPENLRYLLQASMVTREMAGQQRTYPPAVLIRVARVLIGGIPSAKPPPAVPPQMVLHFTIAGDEQEVKVWESDFTYGDQTYHLEQAVLAIIRSEP